MSSRTLSWVVLLLVLGTGDVRPEEVPSERKRTASRQEAGDRADLGGLRVLVLAPEEGLVVVVPEGGPMRALRKGDSVTEGGEWRVQRIQSARLILRGAGERMAWIESDGSVRLFDETPPLAETFDLPFALPLLDRRSPGNSRGGADGRLESISGPSERFEGEEIEPGKRAGGPR